MAIIAYADTVVRATGLSEYKRDMGDSEQAFKGFATAVLGAAVGIGAAVGSIGIGFQDSMAQVKGVMKPTADEFEKLTAAARDMGATTEKSSSMAADGLVKLGMAGLSASDSIKILPGMVDLSTAGVIELSEASDIATNALSAMGLGADQMTRLGNVMVATITNSNTDIRRMGQTFTEVAPIAAGFGVTLEELATHTGILANAGIDAGKAGTGLKNMYIRTAAAAKELNIEGADSITVLKAVRDAQWGVNEITKVYGLEALPAVQVMLKSLGGTGPGSYSDMSVKVRDNEGALKTLAGTMRDTLGGSMKTLMSTLEDFSLTLFNVFGDDAKSIVDGSVQALRKYKDEIILTAQAIIPLVKIVGVTGALMLGMKAAPAVIGAAKGAMVAYNVALQLMSAASVSGAGTHAALNAQIFGGTAATQKSFTAMNALTTTLHGQSVVAMGTASALGAVKVAAGLLFAAFAGWEIGGWLRKWGFIEDAALNTMSALMDTWIMVSSAAERAWFHISSTFSTAMGMMFDTLAAFGEAGSKIASFIGFDSMATSLDKVKVNMAASAGEAKGYAGSIAEINKNEIEQLKLNDSIIAGMRTDIKLTGDIVTKKGELGTTTAKVSQEMEVANAKQLAGIEAGYQGYLKNVGAAGKMTTANDKMNDSVVNTGKVVARTEEQWKKYWDSQWESMARFQTAGEAVGFTDVFQGLAAAEKRSEAAFEWAESIRKKELEEAISAGQSMGATDSFMGAISAADRGASALSEADKERELAASDAGKYAEHAVNSFFTIFESELGRVGQAIEKDFGQVFGKLAQGISLARAEGGEFQIGEFVKANRESLASMAYSISRLFRDQDAVQTKTQVQLDKVAEFASQLGWIGSLVAAGWNMGRAMTESSNGTIYSNGQVYDIGDASTGDYAADPVMGYAGQQVLGSGFRSGGQRFSAGMQSGDTGMTVAGGVGTLMEWTDPATSIIGYGIQGALEDTIGSTGAMIAGGNISGLLGKAFGEEAMPEFNINNLTKQFEIGNQYEGAIGSLFENETGLGAFDTSTMQVHQKEWYNQLQEGLAQGFNSIREQFNNKAYMLVKDLPKAYADTLETFFQGEDFSIDSIMKNEYFGVDEAGERLRKTVAAYGAKLTKIMEAGTVQVVGDYIRNAEGLGDYFRPEAAEALAIRQYQTFDKDGKVTGEKSAIESVTESFSIYQGLVSGFEDIKDSLKFGDDVATKYASTMEDMGVIHQNQIKWLDQMGFSEKALTETLSEQAAMTKYVREQFADARGDILSSMAIPEKLDATAKIISDVSAGFENAGEALRNLGATQNDLEQLESLRLENIKWKIMEVADAITGRFTNVREKMAEQQFIAQGGTAAGFTMNQLQDILSGGNQSMESLDKASALLVEWVGQAPQPGSVSGGGFLPSIASLTGGAGGGMGDVNSTFENLATQIESMTSYVANRDTLNSAAAGTGINDTFSSFFQQGEGYSTATSAGSFSLGAGGTGTFTSSSGQSYTFNQNEGLGGLAAKAPEVRDMLRTEYGIPGFAEGGVYMPGDSPFTGPTGGGIIEVHGPEKFTPLNSSGKSSGEEETISVLKEIAMILKSGKNMTIKIEGNGGGQGANQFFVRGVTNGQGLTLQGGS